MLLDNTVKQAKIVRLCKMCKEKQVKYWHQLCKFCRWKCRKCNKKLSWKTHKKRICVECANIQHTKYRKKNKKRARELMRQWWHGKRLEVKLEVFKQYGNKCKCCGVTSHMFLTIDHINGRAPREIKRMGQRLYYYLRRKKYPTKNYQLLCFNCNIAKFHSGENKCPHDKSLSVIS